MAQPMAVCNVNITRQNNGGFTIHFSMNSKSEFSCFSTAKEVGNYIEEFCSNMPIAISDIQIELNNPIKIKD